MPDDGGALKSLGAQVLQRDWLSANHIVFAACGDAPATIVDTGYARHAGMTLALVAHALAGRPLGRIVNTHLHSDHCGGNQALQARYGGVETLVPAPSLDVVRAWDEERLSYRPTGQRCERFRADGAIAPGGRLRLGTADWQVHAAPGHDPDAVLLFEPQTRTLISGDALWEDRLAIIFPELYGQDGFGPARRTLALIESLAPRQVIPGHGAVFGDVAASRTLRDLPSMRPARW
jgi:glyoxylase-like metal-dependent hydrolase (beta-lactamase superfamily II)